MALINIHYILLLPAELRTEGQAPSYANSLSSPSCLVEGIS